MKVLDGNPVVAQSPWRAVMPRGTNGSPVTGPSDSFVPSAPVYVQPTLPIPGFEFPAAVAGAAMPGAVGAAVRFVLLGPPGSGKSTQGEILAQEKGIPHVSVGELVRQEVASGSPAGQILASQTKGGELADPAVIYDLVQERLSQEDAQKGFVLDGYPRMLSQIPDLERMRDNLDWGPIAVIGIEVPEDEVVRRLSGRGRADDTPEIIRNRMEVYRKETAPVQEFFQARGEYVAIDGTGSVEDVADRIRKAVNP